MNTRTVAAQTTDLTEDPGERTAGNVMLALAVVSILLVLGALFARTSAAWWILALASCAIHDRVGSYLVKAEAQRQALYRPGRAAFRTSAVQR